MERSLKKIKLTKGLNVLADVTDREFSLEGTIDHVQYQICHNPNKVYIVLTLVKRPGQEKFIIKKEGEDGES